MAALANSTGTPDVTSVAKPTRKATVVRHHVQAEKVDGPWGPRPLSPRS